jgi:hypothetical protein
VRSWIRQGSAACACWALSPLLADHADAFRLITAMTTKSNVTGGRSRLANRRRAFQIASAVAASQNAPNQRSNKVFASPSEAQASAKNRTLKATFITVTMCHVNRTIPNVIDRDPIGVAGRELFERLGSTQRSPMVA